MKLLTPFLALTTASAAAVNISTISQFPNGTWLENIAQMQNGSLLVTIIRKAEIHIVTPATSTSNTTSSLVASFPGHNSVLGITEMQHNAFAVAVGNVTQTNSPVDGTFAVYSLDFTSASSNDDDDEGCEEVTVVVKQLASLPSQGLLNGIAFDPPSSTLFIADSWLGNILQLNASSGEVLGTIEHPALDSNFSSPGFVLGVNGVRVHGGWLYFSNTVQSLVGRIELNSIGEGTGVEVEILVQGEEISNPDDLVVLEDGGVLLVRPAADTLQHITLDGEVSEIARGGEVSGATSVIRGQDGEFYLSTSGLVGGVPKEGGRVVRVDL